MNNRKLYNQLLALCGEIEAIIDLANKAQASVSDEVVFMRQISLLFNRVHNMEALKRETALCTLEELEKIEQAARDGGCSGCGDYVK